MSTPQNERSLSRLAQFNAQVQRAEDLQARDPKQYQTRVALFAALGYAAVFLLLMLLLSVAGLALWSITVSGAIFFSYSKRN